MGWRGVATCVASISLASACFLVGCQSPIDDPGDGSSEVKSKKPAAKSSTGGTAATTTSGPLPDESGGVSPIGTNLGPDGTEASGSSSGDVVGGDVPPPRAPSNACNQGAKSRGFLPDQSVNAHGVDRTYDIFVPNDYDGTHALSVVFVLHADLAISLRPYLPIEKESAGKAIVVYPYGFGGWSLDASANNTDMDFLERLKEVIAQDYCVDNDRFFLFGYSQGGFLANMMACFRGPVFKAIAVNSGGLYAPAGAPESYSNDGTLLCPKPPVAALIIHGKSDPQVSYTEDGVRARDTWVLANGCSANSVPFGPDPCVEYTGCASHPVAFCSIDMGHQLWASSAAAAWTFFSKN